MASPVLQQNDAGTSARPVTRRRPWWRSRALKGALYASPAAVFVLAFFVVPLLLVGIEEYWQTFCDLRQEGRVRAVGLSNHDLTQLDAAASVGRVDSVQPRLNLIHRTAADVLEWCAAHGAGAIVYSPMASGLLTGAFRPDRFAALHADDWRREHPDFTGRALERNLALAAALQPVADRYGVTVAAVAVAWTLAFSGVSGAIVGVRRAAQVGDWLAAASLRLDESDLAEIAAAIERTGAGSGPALPT